MQEQQDIQLKPLIEPTPVEFTMDTIGWKMLFFVLLISVLYGIYKCYLHYKSNQYRRDAIVKIAAIESDSELSIPEFITQIMFQIKQTALFAFGRKKVASLEGNQWLQFLEENAKGASFSKYQNAISEAIYKDEVSEESNFNKEEFVKTSINWIRNHAR